jgi:hypothetical protein
MALLVVVGLSLNLVACGDKAPAKDPAAPAAPAAEPAKVEAAPAAPATPAEALAKVKETVNGGDVMAVMKLLTPSMIQGRGGQMGMNSEMPGIKKMFEEETFGEPVVDGDMAIFASVKEEDTRTVTIELEFQKVDGGWLWNKTHTKVVEKPAP